MNNSDQKQIDNQDLSSSNSIDSNLVKGGHFNLAPWTANNRFVLEPPETEFVHAFPPRGFKQTQANIISPDLRRNGGFSARDKQNEISAMATP